jgi:hypothetical protein
MQRKSFIFTLMVGLVMFAACSRGGLPWNAKLVGSFYLSCTEVQQGMYHCRIYARSDRQLVVEKTYVFPSFYGMPPRGDVTGRVSRYDGDVIYLWGGTKLIAGDIPDDARRVQSANGGVWVSCSLADEKQNIYSCTLYSMKDACVLASGAFVPKRFTWDAKAGRTKYQDAKEQLPSLDFVYYGGVGITLKNKQILMPAGWIDYPDKKGGGLRVQYDADGNAIVQEEY